MPFGASVVLANGTPSAVLGILLAATVIFLTGIPISYYSARYAIDMDLLTRGAGVGYLGSTITSLIYASFTFIFFALEGAIMAQAMDAGLGIPLPIGYVITSLVVLPIVIYGMRALSQMQLWTQPIWLLIMVLPSSLWLRRSRVTRSDLLVINKTDLAPLVGTDLAMMRHDAEEVRSGRPTVLISLREEPDAGPVVDWVRDRWRAHAGR